MSMSDASMTSVTQALAGMPLNAAQPDRYSISCHENEVPLYAERELERLYGNIYSSLAEFRIGGALGARPSTYVVRKGEQVSTLFLFSHNKREARVLNEGIQIAADELKRFVHYMFSTYRTLDVITFHAVRPDTRSLAYPYQRFNCLEDIVLTLPKDCSAYLASMGSSTRNYVKRYMNKLKREHPTFRHDVYLNKGIDERDVREVIELNTARMTEKGKVPGIDQQAMQRIIRLVKECGMLSVVRIEGKICAGTINYRVGDNYFLEVIAHDPAFNDYRLGTLCCYLTICTCIERGGHEYHFLWGKNEYKFRLLGVERELDHLAVYRSHRHLVMHAATALRNVANAHKRKAKLWLHELQGRDDRFARFATNSLQAMRNLRTART